ncbi:MAG TPA: hypothetical protein VKA48_06145, partial [Gammaproteobacteria bacterium]|nr:hypothetical protein [Gammaproteobacteria bacterium]
GITELRVLVRPAAERARHQRHRRYSPEASARMMESAREVSDPGLREALLRLAGNLGTPPEGE